jgi:cardiolipin synthase
MDLSLWVSEKLFFNGDQYFDSILEDIAKAQETIDVESYIFEYDELGQKIISALAQAVKRGVQARIIVDGIGSAPSARSLETACKENQIHFRVFHPIFAAFFIPIFKTMNRRNHRKTWIFDRKTAYVGSFNISKVHTQLVPEPWRDSAVRVEGEAVLLLNDAFEKVWTKNRVWKKRLFLFQESMSSLLVRLNDGIHKRRSYYRELLMRIREAKSFIYFGNAYFSPHFRIVMELCYASRRGVEVHVLLPRKSDVFFMPWVSTTYYLALLQSGVIIHEYLPRVFHAKNYIIDNWMLVGSSNLNHRSLFHDLEADVRITQEENQRLFLEEFRKDLSQSEVVTFEKFKKISWIRRMIAHFFLLFKAWL